MINENIMMSSRSTAVVIGSLYILATLSYMIGSVVLIEPALSGKEYLGSVFQNRNILRTGVMIQMVNDLAIIGIGVLLYPILKQYSERVALAVLSLRIIEAVILLTGGISLILLVPLGNEYMKVGNGGSEFEVSALLLQRWSGMAFNTAMICLAIGGFFLSFLLFRQRLISRLIAIIGIVGYPVMFIKILADVYGVGKGLDFLYLPVALFELIFPIWLFIKGFNTGNRVQLKKSEWPVKKVSGPPAENIIDQL